METITIIIISVLGASVVILGFTTWNLLRKVEKTEDIILNYNSYIEEYSKQLDIADKRLKQIDEKKFKIREAELKVGDEIFNFKTKMPLF